MGEINTCLKRTFTIFNILFAIFGGLIILLALLAQFLTSTGAEHFENRTAGLILLYVVGGITMVIAALGAYGANKEKRGALIAFLVFMVIGSLMMLRAGINTAIARPQLTPVMNEVLRRFLPLDTASEDIQDMMNKMQAQVHCCGLFDYSDWGSSVPDSCNCREMDEGEGMCKTISDVSVNTHLFQGYLSEKSIYRKTCFPAIMHYVFLTVDAVIGITLALATLALLGMALSSLMIHQLRHPNRPTMILTVPAVFSPQPPKYQELQNPPAYTIQ